MRVESCIPVTRFITATTRAAFDADVIRSLEDVLLEMHDRARSMRVVLQAGYMVDSITETFHMQRLADRGCVELTRPAS